MSSEMTALGETETLLTSPVVNPDVDVVVVVVVVEVLHILVDDANVLVLLDVTVEDVGACSSSSSSSSSSCGGSPCSPSSSSSSSSSSCGGSPWSSAGKSNLFTVVGCTVVLVYKMVPVKTRKQQNIKN